MKELEIKGAKLKFIVYPHWIVFSGSAIAANELLTCVGLVQCCWMLDNQWQGEEKDYSKGIKFSVTTFSTKQILDRNQDNKDYRQPFSAIKLLHNESSK